ncbi:hypothetical protein BHM03_00012251 [Ensete ventricosum]|nr:hypothetical protein BHM03_00012251 [Ensete ventricosum]
MQEMAQLSLFPPPPPAQPLFLPRVVTGAESVSASCKAATCPWGGEEADGVRGTSSPPAHVLFSRSLVDLPGVCLFACVNSLVRDALLLLEFVLLVLDSALFRCGTIGTSKDMSHPSLNPHDAS